MAKALSSTPSTNSRGEDIKNYLPAFKKGGQIFSGNIAALFLSGSIVSGKKTMRVTHGAGVIPKSIVVCPIATLAQMSAAAAASLSVAGASAATSAYFYVIGSQTQNTAIKYAAYLQF